MTHYLQWIQLILLQYPYETLYLTSALTLIIGLFLGRELWQGLRTAIQKRRVLNEVQVKIKS